MTVAFATSDTTPDATMSLTASDAYVKTNEKVDFTCTVKMRRMN